MRYVVRRPETGDWLRVWAGSARDAVMAAVRRWGLVAGWLEVWPVTEAPVAADLWCRLAGDGAWHPARREAAS